MPFFFGLMKERIQVASGHTTYQVIDYSQPGRSLTGLDCQGCNHGLGFVDPASATIWTKAYNLLQSAIGAIENILGIGQGRREADLIVPTQNQITATVLAPISAEVQQIETLNCNDLRSLLEQLNQSETKWLQFLHDSRFVTAAPTQAEATLAPYFTGLRKDLTDEINIRCTGFGGIGSIDSTTLVSIGLAALFVLPKLFRR
jgi:hypothetical protein